MNCGTFLRRLLSIVDMADQIIYECRVNDVLQHFDNVLITYGINKTKHESFLFFFKFLVQIVVNIWKVQWIIMWNALLIRFSSDWWLSKIWRALCQGSFTALWVMSPLPFLGYLPIWNCSNIAQYSPSLGIRSHSIDFFVYMPRGISHLFPQNT